MLVMKYGAFETVSEMHRGPRASVHVARHEGSSDDGFAVKVVEPNVSIIGQRAAERRCEAFLESMRVQQVIASDASSHWAKVHELGRLDAAAFAVMDRFPSSVEQLITFRRDAEAGQLYTIMSGVTAGLRELADRHEGRGHGNLKPSNVLLGDSGSQVALADPATDSQIAEEQLSVMDDLQAAGGLIYGLVLHREWRGGFGAKVESGPAWNRIGRTGQGWYRLCSGLLEGEGGAHATDAPKTLEEMATAVEALSPSAKSSAASPKLIMAGIGMVAVIGAVIAVAMLRGGGGDAEQQAVVTGTGDPVESDSQVIEVPEDVTEPDEPIEIPTEFATPLQRAWFLALEEDRATFSALPYVRTVAGRSELSDEQVVQAVMQAANEAHALWPTFEANGWHGVRGEFPKSRDDLAALLQDEERIDEQALLGQLRRIAAVLSFYDRDVRSDWEIVFAEALDRIATAGGDAALSQFGASSRQRVASVGTLRALRQTIGDHRRMARDLGEAVESHWSRVDHDYFRDRSGLYPPPEMPDLAYYERWMNAALSGDYGRIDQQPALPDFAMVFGELGRVMLQIRDACGADPDSRAVDDLRQLQSALTSLSWDGTRDSARQFERAIDEFHREASDVRTQFNTALEVCRNCIAELNRQLKTEPDVTGTLRQFWERSKHVIAEADAECNVRVERVRMLREAIANFSREMEIPFAGRWNDPQLRDIAAQHRDSIAAATLSGIDANEAAFDSQQWVQPRAKLHQWLDDAGAWLDAHDELSLQLQQLPRYVEIQQDFDLWNQHAGEFSGFAPLVEQTRQRIFALQSLESQMLAADGRREMLDMLSNAQFPELQVAAWWRLSETMSDPQALQQEQEAWETVSSIFNNVSDDRRSQLQRAMLRERKQRWHRHTEFVDSPQAIVAAIEVRRDFGIDDDSELDGWLQFNVHLHAFLRATRNADESEICNLAGAMLEQMDRFWPVDAHRPMRLNPVRQRLVSMERACSGEGTDFASIGPGVLGWTGSVEEEGRLLRFDPPEAVASEHAPLYFRRLDMPDGRLVFLCTTEVSIGLFKHAMSAHRASLRDWLPRAPRGARGWEVQQDRIVLRDCWLGVLSPNAGFECVGTISSPEMNHPAHQVTIGSAIFVASRLGGRLPTLDEWQRAYTQTYPAGNVPTRSANRRGREWIAPLQAQVQSSPRHEWWLLADEVDAVRRNNPVSTEYSPESPFTDVFFTEARRDVIQLGDEDGWLWFRPVHGDTAGGDKAFRDLVGNVAEFVVTDHKPFEALVAANSLTNNMTRQLFNDHPELEVYVVGASALSDPSLAPDQAELHDIRRRRLPPWTYTFPDVGFRIAIELQPGQEPTASPTTIVEQIRANPPYILASGS